MKKIFALFFLIMLVPSIVSATVNLDFRLDVEEKGFYPNEKIPLDVTVINRDSTFTAGDAELTVYISDRFYTFDLGDLKPGETFEEKITLPEFPPATHTIKGEINYTGILDERFIKTTYGSFEVLFPKIERYPRNVYVSNYDLPEKIIGGKDYDVGITITNDGEVSADLLIEFGSLDEFFTEETTLNSGESTTVKMGVKFENPGVSLIEARVYTVINGEKYLLNYKGKKTYVQGEKEAKLIFDRIELVDEPDNKINQEDTVKLKIFIKNDGETATNVMGELLSTIGKINILDKIVSYLTILKKDVVAPSKDIFEIETNGVEVGDYELDLKLNYVDSEDREKEIKIPITIDEGSDSCSKDADCLESQTCENNQCIDIPCECGYIKDRKCNEYECCSDDNCDGYDICDLTSNSCLTCLDEHCCSEGTMWCERENECVSPIDCLGAVDSPCSNAWPNHEGEKVQINEINFACDLFEVVREDLEYIPEEAVKCYQSGCSDSVCHDYCDVAYKYSGLDQGLTDNRFKKFVGLYIIYGLGPASKWMHEYYSPEIRCSDALWEGKTASCYGSYAPNTKQLQCVYTEGQPEGWLSDSDLSKNSCVFSDLPAHANINEISTGTCVDYSVSLTTLLRMSGYKINEVYSSTGPGHEYNLVKFPGDLKWTLIDTVGNSNTPYVPGSHPQWYPHCDYYSDWCANDGGQGECPLKSEVYGCGG